MIESEKKELRIPTPIDRVLLFDLDKTLINEDYQLTDTAIIEEIVRLKEKGWIIGLNSDTPLEPLLAWKKNLELNGPIIAERGLVIQIPEEELVVTLGDENLFTDIRTRFVQQLVKSRIAFYHGDVVQLIRNRTDIPNLVEQNIALVQAYRRCSFNFFGRIIREDGKMEIDNDFTLYLIQMLKSGSKISLEDFSEDYNPNYGIYILSPRQACKRLGVIELMKRMGLSQIGMVGDSLNDYVGKDLAIHYAVGNADENYKTIADYVSHKTLTEGVVEILSLLE